MPSDSKGLYERIYDVVRPVPAGRVASYGQIAAIFGRCTPRSVGFAMASVPAGSDVPWHRILNGKGEISFRPGSDGHDVQRAMLEAEGVVFDERGRTDLKTFGWTGPGVRRRPRSAA